jgi:hypothetical protein
MEAHWSIGAVVDAYEAIYRAVLADGWVRPT